MNNQQFKPCSTCGKYTPTTVPDDTCSPSCQQAYVKCYNCGKYFILKQDKIKKEEKQTHYYCSKECSIVYKHKKQIIRKYTSRIYYF